jgi:hypothetical protein
MSLSDRIFTHWYVPYLNACTELRQKLVKWIVCQYVTLLNRVEYFVDALTAHKLI